MVVRAGLHDPGLPSGYGYVGRARRLGYPRSIDPGRFGVVYDRNRCNTTGLDPDLVLAALLSPHLPGDRHGPCNRLGAEHLVDPRLERRDADWIGRAHCRLELRPERTPHLIGQRD